MPRSSRKATREEVARMAEMLRVEVLPAAESEEGDARPKKDPLEALARLLASAWLRSQRRGKVRRDDEE